MNPFNTNTLLSSFLEHETIKITDLTEGINEIDAKKNCSLILLLDELCELGFIEQLSGIVPATYTITPSGIQQSSTFK